MIEIDERIKYKDIQLGIYRILELYQHYHAKKRLGLSSKFDFSYDPELGDKLEDLLDSIILIMGNVRLGPEGWENEIFCQYLPHGVEESIEEIVNFKSPIDEIMELEEEEDDSD